VVIAFFDASALIYLLEGQPSLAEQVRQALASLASAHSPLGIAVSRLSWMECRIGPLKDNAPDRLVLFDPFFAQPDMIWVELDRNVVELATEIRVRHSLRTPAALQASCCLQLGPAHRLLTGDRRFQRVRGLRVVCVS